MGRWLSEEILLSLCESLGSTPSTANKKQLWKVLLMCPAQCSPCFTSPGSLTKKGAKMIQWVKAAVAKPGQHPKFNPRTHTVEGEKHVLKVSCDLYTNAVVHNATPHMHTQNK